MNHTAPLQPPDSFRIALQLSSGGHRIDAVLLEELRGQGSNAQLKNISRSALKKLFKERRILIKGQSAVPSSGLAAGITYVDILGFGGEAGGEAAVIKEEV